MMSNGDTVAPYGPQLPFDDPSFVKNISDAVGGAVGHIGESVQQNKQQEAAQKTKFTWDSSTNTVQGTMDADYMKQIASDLNAYKGIRGEYDKMLAQNAMEQAQIKAHPFANTFAQIGAAVAAQSRNPISRGLGVAAERLNPTMDQLQKQRMGLLKGEEGAIGGGLGAASTALAFQREERMAQSSRAAQAGKTFHELGMAAQKGELTDPSITSQVLQDGGIPKEKADAQAQTLVGISKEKKALTDAATAATDKRTSDRLKEMARESDNRLAVMLKGLSVKTSDKAEADKAVEETAQSVAKGDLSSIRDITSFRDNQRIKIYARAKEINPKFSVAETKRKIDTMQSFTVGKDGQSIQSFDTFLQHAGELDDTLNRLYQSGSPALNKPMNWIRKNAAGNPEYQRLLTAIEPVGKEFESFLLNQRALYTDDRKRIDTLLDGNSSPAQIRATLGQMGKTAKDRFTAMNQRYKRVIGQDIENPFSPEAEAAAQKIGVDLPRAKSDSSTKYPWEK